MNLDNQSKNSKNTTLISNSNSNQSNPINILRNKLNLSEDTEIYDIKVKRGLFWSDRLMIIANNKVTYFNYKFEKRYEEEIHLINILSEENPKSPLEHVVVLSNKKNEYTLSIKNNIGVYNSSCSKKGVKGFLKEIRTWERSSNVKGLIINKDEYGKINKSVKSLESASVYEECNMDNPMNLQTDEIEKDNQEGNKTNKENHTKNNVNHKKIEFMCISIESAIINSINIPMTEILKSLLNQKYICFISDSLSSIFTTISMRDYIKLFKENRSLNETTNDEDNENDENDKNNESDYEKSHKTSISLSYIPLLILYYLIFICGTYDIFFNRRNESIQFLIILYIVFILSTGVYIKRLHLKNKKLNVKTSTDKHISSYNNIMYEELKWEVVKTIIYLNVNFKDCFTYIKSNKNINKLFANLKHIENNKYMNYIFNKHTDGVFQLTTTRLAIKKSNFYIISEFEMKSKSLIRLILIENEVFSVDDSKKERKFCRVSQFLCIGNMVNSSFPQYVMADYVHFLTNLSLSFIDYNESSSNKEDFLQIDKNIRGRINELVD